MHINVVDNCIYYNPTKELTELLDLKFLNEEFQGKFNNCKYPKLILENNEIVDIVEDAEKIKQNELNYTVVEDKPSEKEIQFAEYVLATEDRLLDLENKINGGN